MKEWQYWLALAGPFMIKVHFESQITENTKLYKRFKVEFARRKQEKWKKDWEYWLAHLVAHDTGNTRETLTHLMT